MNRSMVSVKSVILLVLSILGFSALYRRVVRPPSRTMMANIPFRGTASGGTLVFGDMRARNAFFVSIDTLAGESAEAVVYKLAEAVNSSDILFEWSRDRGQTDPDKIAARTAKMAKGNTLRIAGAPQMYFLAGTETGLGIPEPPLSLSCTYNKKDDKIALDWINPSGDYDRIIVTLRWNKNDSGRRRMIDGSTRIIDGSPSRFELGREKVAYDINDLDVWMVGFRNGTPSSVAAIRLFGNAQEELFGFPFTSGVAPNWKAWSVGKAIEKGQFVSRQRKGLTANEGIRYNSVEEPEKKPFQQVLKTPAGGGTVGIWRKFLGLAPGHKYKLTARLNTFEMDANDGDWTFSLHLTPNGADGKNLTTNQFAGLEPLPDGSSGLEAGRIAIYGPGITTKGNYVEHSADVTLPEGTEAITVWLRHSSNSASAGVGFDWIRLEDISAQ